MEFVKNKKILIVALVILFLLLFYLVVISYYVPLIDEDFDLYAFGKPINAIVSQCVDQYMSWNARIGDVLSIIFSALPRGLYNVINGISIFGFIILITHLSKVIVGKVKVNTLGWVTSVIISFLILVFLLPSPNEIFFWRTGAANYFYPTLFSLLYTLPLLRYLVISKTIKNPILITVYILAGIIVGHSNENVAPVMFAFFSFWVIFKFIRERAINKTFVASTLALLIGTVLLLFGPSTQHRIAFYNKINGDPSILQNIFSNFVPAMTNYLLLIVPSLVITFLLVHSQTDSIKRRKLWIIMIFSYSASLASVFILLCAPYYVPRALFFSVITLVIPVIASLISIARRQMSVLFAFSLTLLIVTTPILIKQLIEMRQYNQSKTQWIKTIEQQLAKSGKATVKPLAIDESLLIYNGQPSEEVIRIAHFLHYPEGSIRVE